MRQVLSKKTFLKILIIFVMVISVGWGYIYYFSTQKERKKLLEERLYSYTRILCKKESILKEKKQIDTLYAQLQHLFLKAQSEADASLQLQEIVSSVAEKSGLSIERLEVPKVYKTQNGEQFIKIKVYFSAQPSTVLEFLYNLEATHHLILDEFELRKVKRRIKKQTQIQIGGYVGIKALLRIGENT